MNPTLDEKILTLLQLTCVNEEEKNTWAELLSVLTDKEKEMLEANLLMQLEFEFEKGKRIGKEFVQITQKNS